MSCPKGLGGPRWGVHSRPMRTVLAVIGATAAAWAAAYAVFVEQRHANANASLRRPRDTATRALLVLGCPPKEDGTLGDTQRWRVDMAVREWRTGDRVVISGAACAGLPSEADVMADYAQECGVPSESLVRETRARSTRENVSFAAQWLTGVDEIMIVSDPLHARRARTMMRRQIPALSLRVVGMADYRRWEHPWRKTLSALFESPLRPTLLWVHRHVLRRRRRHDQGTMGT